MTELFVKEKNFDKEAFKPLLLFSSHSPASQFQEKYTAQTFKIAKALHKKLNRLCVFQLWDHYFGEATDFLHSDLKSEKALNIMNDLGTLIESHMQGQPEFLMGMLFFELCRMAEPWLTQFGRTVTLDPASQNFQVYRTMARLRESGTHDSSGILMS